MKTINYRVEFVTLKKEIKMTGNNSIYDNDFFAKQNKGCREYLRRRAIETEQLFQSDEGDQNKLQEVVITLTSGDQNIW